MDAFITRRGGAGGGLNFKVVGGTTQPRNPKENTIWVNTPNEITGWSVSDAKPSDPADGMVWVEVNKNGNIAFNALEENEIILKPISCSQYVGTAWEPMEASIYINGDWEPFDIFLAEYQQVEYLEGNGGQWIKTDYIQKANTEYDYELMVPAAPGNVWAMGAIGDKWFGIQLGSDGLVYYVWSGVSGSTNVSSVYLNTKHTISYKNGQVLRDGSVVATKTSGQASANYPVWLFVTNNKGSVSNDPAKIKVFSIKFYEDGEMVRDFVPCYRKSDSVAGLFDRVTETFYTNAGTGTFTVGGDVE